GRDRGHPRRAGNPVPDHLRHQRQHPPVLVDRQRARGDRLRTAGRQPGEFRRQDRRDRPRREEGPRMTAEDELREVERTLASYRETLKEVNRLGGDGMAAVRAEWLLRIKELEQQR